MDHDRRPMEVVEKGRVFSEEDKAGPGAENNWRRDPRCIARCRSRAWIEIFDDLPIRSSDT